MFHQQYKWLRGKQNGMQSLNWAVLSDEQISSLDDHSHKVGVWAKQPKFSMVNVELAHLLFPSSFWADSTWLKNCFFLLKPNWGPLVVDDWTYKLQGETLKNRAPLGSRIWLHGIISAEVFVNTFVRAEQSSWPKSPMTFLFVCLEDRIAQPSYYPTVEFLNMCLSSFHFSAFFWNTWIPCVHLLCFVVVLLLFPLTLPQ